MMFLSVCSGIEAASVAWTPLGWEAVAFSEIEAFPSAVLAHHYPAVPNLGDMTKFKEWPDERPDVLVGGTPCQSFSVAGLRKGLVDPRGQLALVYLAIADRYRPRWVVWENVPGVLSADGGRAFGSFLGGLEELGYGWAYRVLDAQYFGVAQRRRRVFVVGYLGDWRRAAAVLLERESMSGHPAPSREAGKRVAGQSKGGTGGCFQNTGQGWRNESYCAQSLRDASAGGTIEAAQSKGNRGQGILAEVAPTLRSLANQGPGRMADDAARMMMVRRLTPRECERLQGFDDDYTLIRYRGKPAADGPRYKALGNSMAVPVMRWIGEKMELVEKESIR